MLFRCRWEKCLSKWTHTQKIIHSFFSPKVLNYPLKDIYIHPFRNDNPETRVHIAYMNVHWQLPRIWEGYCFLYHRLLRGGSEMYMYIKRGWDVVRTYKYIYIHIYIYTYVQKQSNAIREVQMSMYRGGEGRSNHVPTPF